MVLLTALIRELHCLWQCPIDIITSGAWSEPLLRGQPGVGEIYTLRSRKTPYWFAPDQWRLVRALRAQPRVPMWFCDGGDAGKALLARAGIGPAELVDVNAHPLLPGEHATQQWLRLAQLLPAAFAGVLPPGALLGTLGCELQILEAQRADLAAWRKARGFGAAPLVLVQIGNKRTMRRGTRRLAANHKYWPPERWAAVLHDLRARHPAHRILLLGTGPEYALNEALREMAGITGLDNVADDLPIPRLVALLGVAAALITVDSGPAHVAAAVGCPQVVLFGKASPALYRPWGVAGPAVELLTGTVEGAPSMLGISTEAVIDATRRLKFRDGPESQDS